MQRTGPETSLERVALANQSAVFAVLEHIQLMA